MTPLNKVRERYENDPVFHRYVDMMRMAIQELHLTPSELREAAMLAAIIEEERRPPEPFHYDPACPPIPLDPIRGWR